MIVWRNVKMLLTTEKASVLISHCLIATNSVSLQQIHQYANPNFIFFAQANGI